MHFKRLRSCRILSSQPPEIYLELTSVEVVGQARPLRVVWSTSMMEDVRSAMAMEVENMLWHFTPDDGDEDIHVQFRKLRKMRLTVPDTINRAVSEALEDWAKMCRGSADGVMAPMAVVYRAPRTAEYIEINMTITPSGVQYDV